MAGAASEASPSPPPLLRAGGARWYYTTVKKECFPIPPENFSLGSTFELHMMEKIKMHRSITRFSIRAPLGWWVLSFREAHDRLARFPGIKYQYFAENGKSKRRKEQPKQALVDVLSCRHISWGWFGNIFAVRSER